MARVKSLSEQLLELPHPSQEEVRFNARRGWNWCLVCQRYVGQHHEGHDAQQIMNAVIAYRAKDVPATLTIQKEVPNEKVPTPVHMPPDAHAPGAITVDDVQVGSAVREGTLADKDPS